MASSPDALMTASAEGEYGVASAYIGSPVA